MVSRAQLVSLLVLGLVYAASGFYLPGVAPRKYVHGEQLTVKVNTLTSDLTPLQVAFLSRSHPAAPPPTANQKLL